MPQMRSEAEVRAILGELITDKEGFEDWPVERIAISDFKPAAYNPRTISDSGLKRLARSLKANGRLDTLVVNRRTGNLVSGHQRFSVLLAAGLTETWATVVDVPEYREKSMNIAANNREAQGEFELEGLADLLKELQEIDAPDFSIEDTAFELGEVMDILAEHGDEPEGNTDPDEVPEVPVKPVSKTGDLWLLGEHRVLCGDSTKAEDVDRLMAGERAAAAVSDPPYGIGFDYAHHDDSRDKWFGLMDAAVPLMRQHAPFVVMPSCGIDRMGWWYKNHEPDWLIAWYKGSPGHLSKIGFNDWEAHVIWGRPHNQMHDYFQTECGFDKDLDHPCPKPVAYAEWLVARAAPDNGVILDLFLGSGTTLIACEKLNRRCYGMEIAPQYVDVIVKRWQDFTEREATLDGDGRTFAEIAEERSGD